MSVGRFLQQAAAGNASGEAVYVEDVFSTNLYTGTQVANRGISTGLSLGDGLAGGEATYFRWDNYLYSSTTPSNTATAYTVSMYIKGDANSISQRPFQIHQQATFTLGSSRIDFNANRADGNGAAIAWYFTHTGKFISGQWNHILFSVSNNGQKYMYINDQPAAVFAGSVYSTSPMFGVAPAVGGNNANGPTAGNSFDGSLARIYVKREYLDLSVESNRRIFVNADLTPVSHSSLSARSPDLYMPLGSNYLENLGTESQSFSVIGDGTPKLTTGVDSVSTGKGGMIWFKNRTTARNHVLFDTERGVYKRLITNATSTEASDTSLLSHFGPDSVTIGSGTESNGASEKIVSWTFRQQPGFFDVVTYTGNGVAGTEIAHSLGSTPGMIVVKTTGPTFGGAWRVWHRSVSTSVLRLNTTDGTSAIGNPQNTWGNDSSVIQPTSTHFTIGSESDVNRNGAGYVAYIFAHDAQDFGTDSDESIIKCGSYTTDGSGNASIDLGFEPQFILAKRSSGTGDWFINDTMRGIASGGNDPYVVPNTTAAENSSYDYYDLTSTGFKHKAGFTNSTYIYVAIRRPHKPASEFAATDLFSVLKNQPEDSGQWYHSHLTDFSFYHWQYGAQNWGVQDRLRGSPDLSFNSTAAESSLVGGNSWDRMEGYYNNGPGGGSYTSWAFRRAPGFFDVVTYKGTGTSMNIPHSLGVVPELIIVKKRNTSGDWFTWHTSIGTNNRLILNSTLAVTAATTIFPSLPTSSQFTVGTSAGVSGSTDNFVAYLFATVPGISKVGSYTGTGSNLDIDCGFTSGARLVLIKRTNNSGEWYLWDYRRGIVAGNDPYILLNSSAAEITYTDYIDPLSSGFTVTGSAPGDINGLNDSFIFLAIA